MMITLKELQIELKKQLSFKGFDEISTGKYGTKKMCGKAPKHIKLPTSLVGGTIEGLSKENGIYTLSINSNQQSFTNAIIAIKQTPLLKRIKINITKTYV